MKFYAEPNLLVRPRKTGVFRRIKPFRFDANGEYETENKHLIKVLSRRFGGDETIAEELTEFEEIDKVLTDDEIRVMAKDAKIKSWHIKSIEKLREELGV
jgi:hypothetical protein